MSEPVEVKGIPIDQEHCQRDEALENIIMKYKEETDLKYKRVLTRFVKKYTHPVRNQETMLGPIVQYEDLRKIYPYNDEIYRIVVDGEQLRRMICHILREEAFTGHTEFYQYSRGFRIEYDRPSKQLISLSLNGYEVRDKDRFRVGLPSFHMKNIQQFLNVSEDEASLIERPKVISTNSADILEEYFSAHELIRGAEESRLIIIE